jgi:hypothetical protein
MDYLPSPSSPAPPHLRLTHRASLNACKLASNQRRLSDPIDTLWQCKPLPPPSSLIRADDSPLSSRPLHSPRGYYSSVRSQTYSLFHPSRPVIQLPCWPMVRTLSPRRQLSPLPSKRQLKKKPPVACLFCRGRKIACGPPDLGSEDLTCK